MKFEAETIRALIDTRIAELEELYKKKSSDETEYRIAELYWLKRMLFGVRE